MERIELKDGWLEVVRLSPGSYAVRVYAGGQLVGEHVCEDADLRAALKKLGVGKGEFNAAGVRPSTSPTVPSLASE